MKPLTCVIIDDEPLAAEMLAGYARKTPVLTLVGVYNSAVEAMRTIRETPVDVLFLDIQMPELSGLEFATILPEETMIVFTTAFNQYAIDSYKVNTVDYLMKPISYEAFLKATEKAMKRQAKRSNAVEAEVERFIYVKSDYKLVRVVLDDILYIEGLKDYVRIVLSGGQAPVMCLMTMNALLKSLPQTEFMRVHRSYIVHLPKADAIERLQLVFGETRIPVSDSYKEEFLEYVNRHVVG